MRGRTAPDWLTRWEYAHRGLHGGGVPENSLEGARRAIAAGMGVECDIQRSLDNHPMVYHDWDLTRLTGAAGATDSQTADQLQRLLYLDSDERPSTLLQLLEVIAGAVPILVEIKSKPGYDATPTCLHVSRLLEDYTGQIAVMSFDPQVARWFRRNASQITCGLVIREDEYGYTQTELRRRLAYWIARPDFIAYHIAALPNPWIARLRADGVPVLTWTVNSRETRVKSLLHADAIVSEGEGLP